MDLFYAIPGTLDKKKENVEPGPKPKGVDKIFIQSTSHGTRCLKQGTKLLIKTGMVVTVYANFFYNNIIKI